MIALIPARGGSKGLPGKNIKLLKDKPLIAYSIEAALQSKYITNVFVSTDDVEIAETSKIFGAEVPFLRPDYLATDKANAIDNYIYTIHRLQNDLLLKIEDFIVLQPTSPLRNSKDIDAAIELFYLKDADSVISICESAHPPIWAKRITEKGTIENYFDTDLGLKNRQEIPKAFMPNGAIYIFKTDLIVNKKTYYSHKSYPFVMTQECSIDIDTLFDFELAEFFINRKNDKH